MATRRVSTSKSRDAGVATRKFAIDAGMTVGDFIGGLIFGEPKPAPRKRSTKRKPSVTRKAK